MATTINADTSNGVIITPDTSGEIKLQSAGADIVSVTANGMAVDTDTLYVDAANNKVGIGTASPAQKLHISNSGLSSAIAITDSGSTGDGFYIQTYNGNANIWNGSAKSINFATNNTERMRIDSSGSLRVGGTASFSLNEKIALYGTSTANNPTIISDKAAAGVVSSNHILFNNGNGYVGSITTLNSGTGFNTSSDYRLKNNVTPMSGSIDRLKQLKPSTWSWTQDGSHGEGFLAHEAQTVVPEAVTGTKDAIQIWKEGEELPEGVSVGDNKLDENGNTIPEYQGIDQSKLVPLLTAALQEAITKIEDLETRIQALESV